MKHYFLWGDMMMSTRRLETVSQLITLGLGTRKFASMPLHSVRKLALVIAVLAIGTSVRSAQAEFWYEDFTDGSISDSGIDWTLTSRSTFSSDGLELNSSNGIGGNATAELPVRGQSWSIRTEARLLRDLGVLGAAAGDTWSGISVNGGALLGKGGRALSDTMATDLRPAEEDVIVQFDTFDNVLRMWAWRGENSPAQDIEPLVEIDAVQPGGFPFLWTNSLIHPTSSAQFSWIAISTEHMPVNMEVPLSDLIGDFSGDDVLDVADIDLLGRAIQMGSVHPQYDLNRSGAVDLEDHAYWVSDLNRTWMGDANLDGNVNFADFVALADHFGGPGGWGQGDFNADGTVQFPDFAILASNYGMTSTAVAAAVPEPCSAVLLMIGVLLPLVTRRAAAAR